MLRLYHVLLDVVVLRHLDECLEQPAVMLDEDLAGFSVTTLSHTMARMRNVKEPRGGLHLHQMLTCTHRSRGVIPFLSATYLAPRDKRICAVSRCPWLKNIQKQSDDLPPSAAITCDVTCRRSKEARRLRRWGG